MTTDSAPLDQAVDTGRSGIRSRLLALAVGLTFACFAGAPLSIWSSQPALAAAVPPGASIPVRGFVRVIDGRSLEAIVQGHKIGIGLIGIRVPEGNTACGQQASSALQSLVKPGVDLQEDLSIVRDASGQRHMYYASTVDGRPLADLLVQAGLARADGTGAYSARLTGLQNAARAAPTGCLWGGPVQTIRPPNAGGGSAPTPIAASVPSGFREQVMASGMAQPTAMTFLPDGRILLARKTGVVLVYKSGALLATPFIDISAHVNAYWDHGLLGIAADPNFASNGYVYLLYVYENDASQFSSTKTSRLTRVTATGDTASPATEITVLGTVGGPTCTAYPEGTDCIPADGASHSVGNIKFATDGTMFVTSGDSSSFTFVDNLALRAQNLDSLAGKMLHVTTGGQGVASNPYYNGNPGANRSKVWNYGLRNAYRFNLRPGSGIPFLGDVGWNTWEEIDLGFAGANQGWPCYEGPSVQPGYQPLAACQQLYATGTSAVSFPLITYDHCCGSSAVTAGAFYTGTTYPSQYQGAYFYGDYGRGFIRYATFDAANNLTSGPFDFVPTGADGPVDIEMGPDSSFWYISINTGQLRRISYTAGNTPPVAVASANPTQGPLPLNVQFRGDQSSDPDGDVLTFDWNFGDGSAHSTLANPQHTYTIGGLFGATLTVDDGHANQSSASVPITAGRPPPVPTISSPGSSLAYRVSDVINFAGSASDSVDGTVAPSGLTWQVVIHHCPGGTCHTHFFLDAVGASGNFTVPDHGDSSYFEIALKATNSGGLSATTSVTIQPQTTSLTLNTNPGGLQVVYGGTAVTAPFTVNTIVGSTHTIYAPSPQGAAAFASWSDAGAQQHNVLVGSAPASYTASFNVAPPGFIQSATNRVGGESNTSVSVTPGGTLRANDRLVVVVGVWGFGLPVARAVTDSAGNQYTELLHFTASDGTEESMWTAPILAGAGTRPTVTAATTGVSDIGVAVLEYSNLSAVANATVLDQSATATGVTSGAAVVRSGPTPPTTGVSELAVGAYVDSGFGDTLNYGAGWSGRAAVSPTSDIEFAVEDQVVPLGATPNASIGTGPGTPWLMLTAVFKSAPAAAATVPGAPTNVQAAAGNGQATVTWASPPDGGRSISGYTVTASSGGATSSVGGSATSAVVTGLINGTSYTFTVTATNSVGTGPTSAPSNPVTPATVPGSPTSVRATAGNASATVSWVAPLNGGSPITSYAVTASPGGATASTGGGTVAVVSGLANGTSYTFTVTATNAVGAGPASAPSNPVTPQGSGQTPTFVQRVTSHVAGRTSATVTPAANLGSGSRVVVVVGVWGNNAPTAAGVSDSAGNTYTELVHFAASDNTEQSVWSAPISAGVGTRPVITVTTTDTADIGVAALEYSGLSAAAGSAVLDRVATASGTTTGAATVASAATQPATAPNELAIGIYVDSGFGDTLAFGSGWLGRANVSPTADMEFAIEDVLVAQGATPSASVGTGPSTTWLMATVVLKAG